MKKPCPLSARSRLLSVKSMLPCVNCCATLVTRTPLPIALLLTPCGDTENSSANSAREPLKPLVAVLAMLLAVTVRSACAAFKPLKARRKVMEVSDCVALHDLAHVAERAGAEIVGVQDQSGRVDRHAVDPAREQHLQRSGLAGGAGNRFDLVVAGGGTR